MGPVRKNSFAVIFRIFCTVISVAKSHYYVSFFSFIIQIQRRVVVSHKIFNDSKTWKYDWILEMLISSSHFICLIQNLPGTKSPRFKISLLQNFPVTKSPRYKISQLQNLLITKFPHAKKKYPNAVYKNFKKRHGSKRRVTGL